MCKRRREEGRSTRVADFADATLENEAFRESVTTALVSLGSIVTEKSERLLDILRFTDSGEDEKHKEEQKHYVLRRLQNRVATIRIRMETNTS